MKPIEAIEAIRKSINIGYDNTDGRDRTALTFYDSDADTILKALEKQIPRKPKKIKRISWSNMPYIVNKCPECGCDVTINDCELGYCENCGQKIDWEATQ